MGEYNPKLNILSTEKLIPTDAEEKLSWLGNDENSSKHFTINKYSTDFIKVLSYNSNLEIGVNQNLSLKKLQYEKFDLISKFSEGSSLRSLVLIVDYSMNIETIKHIKPDLITNLDKGIVLLINTFFQHSPLGEMALLAMNDTKVIGVSLLVNNPEKIKRAWIEFREKEKSKGFISIVDTLEKAKLILDSSRNVAYSREIIIINSSINTKDSSLLFDTLNSLVKKKIVCNVISLSPMMSAYDSIVKQTKGEYFVCLSTEVFYKAIQACVKFRSSVKKQTDMILMGFPTLQTLSSAIFCCCHSRLILEGYRCPRCLQFNCSVPSICKCNLQLCTSLDIFRCKNKYNEIIDTKSISANIKDLVCVFCDRKIVSGAYQCTKCNSTYCIDCETLIEANQLPCGGCFKNRFESRRLKQLE